MTRHAGGTQVRSGYYVDARSFAFANIERDGMTLPGGPDRRYLRVPTLAVMAAAPALGGLFVVALPFLGFGVGAYALARKLGAGARRGAEDLATSVAVPVPVPGRAHLTGQEPGEARGEAKEAAAAQPGDGTEQLAKEIEEQRGVIH